MTLHELVEHDRPLRRYGNEYRGACFHCGGDEKSDRFIVWPEKGRYYCRQCGVKGDTIQYLRDCRGLSFRDAATQVGKELTHDSRRHVERTRQAREAVLHRFYTWTHAQRRQLDTIGEQIFIAEIAYRSLCRAPEVWPEEEQDFWIARLGQLYLDYDRIVYETDILVNDPATAWRWWRVETNA